MEATLPTGCRAVIDPDDPRRSSIPGYGIREDGNVLRKSSARKWLPLKVEINKERFHRVRLVVAGRPRYFGVAGLVLRAFVGPRPMGCEPLHFPDPDPGNNGVDNLRWAPIGSSKVGRQFAPGTPAVKRGEENPAAKLIELEVREIRDLYRSGLSQSELAGRFVVNRETIRKILNGQTWSHPGHLADKVEMRRPGPNPEGASKSALTWEEVREIRRLHADGITRKQLSDMFPVSAATIWDIIRRRTWIEEAD